MGSPFLPFDGVKSDYRGTLLHGRRPSTQSLLIEIDQQSVTRSNPPRSSSDRKQSKCHFPFPLSLCRPSPSLFCQLCWTAPVAAQPATPHFPVPNVSLAYLAKLPSRSLAHCNCIRSTKQNNEPNPFPCTMSPVTSIRPPSVWSIPEPVLRNPASDVPPTVPPHALTPSLSLISPAQGR